MPMYAGSTKRLLTLIPGSIDKCDTTQPSQPGLALMFCLPVFEWVFLSRLVSLLAIHKLKNKMKIESFCLHPFQTYPSILHSIKIKLLVPLQRCEPPARCVVGLSCGSASLRRIQLRWGSSWDMFDPFSFFQPSRKTESFSFCTFL